MRMLAIAAAVIAATLSTTAMADEVTCESRSHARQECEMDTGGVVRMVRQLSSSPCTEGVTWGYSKHAVWVEQGCRAVFESGGGDAPVASAPAGGVPFFNGTCPGGHELHADQGGPVYVDGNETTLKKFNDNYYEAKDAKSGITLSITRNPDGSTGVSYTGAHGANGICQVQ